jgi:N-acetylneuraminic acid mutarotase
MNTVLHIRRALLSIVFATLLFGSNESAAQTWKLRQSIPNTPNSGRWGAQCFSLNNKIYVGGGYIGNSVSLSDLWEYDPQADTWTRRRNIPGAVNRTGGIAFSANGKGYVGLGSSSYNTFQATFLSDLWQYDPGTDSWTKMASLPDSARHHATCFTVGDRAYVVGGTTGYPYLISNDVWEYNASSNTWTARTPYPAVSIENAMAFTIGTDGYVVGGFVKQPGTSGYGRADSATYQYNTTNHSWTKKADYCNRRMGGVGFSLNNIGYVGFGTAKIDSTTWYYEEFCKYDPVSNAWTTSTSYPNIARTYSIAAVANGKAYAGAGFIYLTGEEYKSDWAELTPAGVGLDASGHTANGVQLYPNPANNTLRLRSSSGGELQFINIQGQLVKSIIVQGGNSVINVSSFPDGVYMVKMAGAVHRLVVQH